MDFTPVLQPVFHALWYLAPLLLLSMVLKSPWFKGVFGEWLVNVMLKVRLPKQQYHLIKNVTLPTEDGTTQIDHIVVSCFGIFVLETKNMKGWIFGNANQKQWTQKIFKHSSKFQNPLHQNYKHVKTLEACLNVPEGSIFSVVVFVGDSTFKTPMPENVTYAGGCARYILSQRETLLSEEQMHDVIEAIENGRLARSFKTNREHVAHVKQIVVEKEQANHCPKCGSNLVLRESKKGGGAERKFWGCAAFPRCRFVKPAESSL